MSESLSPIAQRIRTALGAAFDNEAKEDLARWDPSHDRGSLYDGVVNLDRMAQRIAADLAPPAVEDAPDDPATVVAKCLSVWLAYGEATTPSDYSALVSKRLFEGMEAALNAWKESDRD